jgi:hypothetical protein
MDISMLLNGCMHMGVLLMNLLVKVQLAVGIYQAYNG